MLIAKICIVAVKTILIFYILKLASKVFFPLQLLFCSKIFLLFAFQSISIAIYDNKLNVNTLPYIGFIFVYIDSIILSMFDEKN